MGPLATSSRIVLDVCITPCERGLNVIQKMKKKKRYASALCRRDTAVVVPSRWRVACYTPHVGSVCSTSRILSNRLETYRDVSKRLKPSPSPSWAAGPRRESSRSLSKPLDSSGNISNTLEHSRSVSKLGPGCRSQERPAERYLSKPLRTSRNLSKTLEHSVNVSQLGLVKGLGFRVQGLGFRV